MPPLTSLLALGEFVASLRPSVSTRGNFHILPQRLCGTQWAGKPRLWGLPVALPIQSFSGWAFAFIKFPGGAHASGPHSERLLSTQRGMLGKRGRAVLEPDIFFLFDKL